MKEVRSSFGDVQRVRRTRKGRSEGIRGVTDGQKKTGKKEKD